MPRPEPADVRIAVDSNDLPAATRLDTWRGLLCDTYMGVDGRFPTTFRSVVEGHAMGGYTLTRMTTTRNIVERSPTLIRRDGLELIFFGAALEGRAVTVQGGREAVLEPGTVVVSDSSRPFATHVEMAADIVWLSVPKATVMDRLRCIEDQVALTLRPDRPIAQIARQVMSGLDAAAAGDLPAGEATHLTTRLLDVVAMAIMAGVGQLSGPRQSRPQR